MFVQRSSASSLVARLAARAGHLRIGPATDSETNVGPLTDGVQLAGMLCFIDACVDRGAKLAAGGYRVADPDLAGGFFIAPTVLADCTDDMLTPAAGGAGPLLAVLSFDDECEVLERAALLRLVRVKRIHAETVQRPSQARVTQAHLEL